MADIKLYLKITGGVIDVETPLRTFRAWEHATDDSLTVLADEGAEFTVTAGDASVTLTDGKGFSLSVAAADWPTFRAAVLAHDTETVGAW